MIAVRPITGSGGADDLQLRLQSYAEEPVAVVVTFEVPPAYAWRTTFLGDDGDVLPVDDTGRVTVPMPRLGSAAVRIRW